MFNQLLLNGVIAGSIYALIALGFTVIYRTVKFFHFAHGVVYTGGAYLAFTLGTFLGFNPIIGFFLPRFLRVFSV
jgi:branched-chain amino acid transport system permease protein